jgi:ribulose-phosphate 3-epimerase
MEYPLQVSPSLLGADFGALGEASVAAESGGAGSLHLDYMDGHYVPNISFGLDLIPALKKRVHIPLIANLMISNAEERLDDFIAKEPDYIIVQEDAVRDLEGVLRKIKRQGIKNGFAINPDRLLKPLEDILHQIDFLLILSVFPGFGGQTFMEETLEKMEHAHKFRGKNTLPFDIGVDGGVNMQTGGEIIKAGANVLVAGTAIFGKPDAAEAIQDFLALDKKNKQ